MSCETFLVFQYLHVVSIIFQQRKHSCFSVDLYFVFNELMKFMGAVDWVAIILVGNCPRWELSGGSCQGAVVWGGGQLSRGQLT